MSIYMIRKQNGKLLPWTASSTQNRAINEIISSRGASWEELSHDGGYEVVKVVARDTAAPALLAWLQWIRANLITLDNYPDDVIFDGLMLDDAIAAAAKEEV